VRSLGNLIIVMCYDNYMPFKRTDTKSRKRGRPPTGAALSAAERMRRLRERKRAAGFRAETRWMPAQSAPYSGAHRLAEVRSLAMHAVIARKIDRDPTLLDIPRRNLERWSARAGESPPSWLQEWHTLLALPWPELAARITEPTEDATRLRQSSPFAGVLSETERARIYEAFRA
jgi:hypothetical protein